MTNILTSDTAKQVFGAVGGMAIATVLYLGFDSASYTSIKGMLVTTKTMSPSAEVSINAKDVDESVLRRIAARAQTVAAALGNTGEPLQAETPLTQTASSRRATRQFAVQLKELASSATTYVNDPNREELSRKDRIDLRAARALGQPAPASADTLKTPPETVATASVSALHESASALPDSGLGLNFLVLLTFILAFATSNTTWRSACASFVARFAIR